MQHQIAEGISRIIPALAGNTTGGAAHAVTDGDHPRSRGEYETFGGGVHHPHGSSPLSRGIPSDAPLLDGGGGIIPALAGNTACPGCRSPGRRDHPRSRGEYAYRTAVADGAGGSSPLSRGIHRRQPVRQCSAGIIPALAGNTLASGVAAAITKDHPRSRGEYPSAWANRPTGHGSSPLSRGILVGFPIGDLHEGIIPALAGNTMCRGMGWGRRSDHPRSRGEYLDT